MRRKQCPPLPEPKVEKRIQKSAEEYAAEMAAFDEMKAKRLPYPGACLSCPKCGRSMDLRSYEQEFRPSVEPPPTYYVYRASGPEGLWWRCPACAFFVMTKPKDEV